MKCENDACQEEENIRTVYTLAENDVYNQTKLYQCNICKYIFTD